MVVVILLGGRFFKNGFGIVENCDMKKMIEFLFIDERSVLENFKKDIKELRRSLKDIKKLSGRSFEGI